MLLCQCFLGRCKQMPSHQAECESRPSNNSTKVQLGEPMKLLAYYRHGHFHIYRSVGDGKTVASW